MSSDLPPLPSWPVVPEDLSSAIRRIKAAIGTRIAASGRSVEQVFAAMRERVVRQVEEIVADRAAGRPVWPVIDYADIEEGRVAPAVMDLVRRRGCAVIRGTFSHSQGLAWDRQMVDYVESNHFFENYRGPADDFFSTVESKPEIYPVYWSRPQMEARQSPRMAQVQSFLNSFWVSRSEGVQWFDQDRDSLYADRIRRRPPGTTSAGLGTHLDPGTLDLWMTADYQRAFRHLFDGSVESYDPWDASHRTGGPQYPGTTMCSAFRTFQGWTALSDMDHDQGVLHTIPIPEAMGMLLLRPLLDDVEPDDLCSVALSRTFPVNQRFHPELLPALTGIPDVRAGDTVWWHCDMIHSVAPVTDQQGWGNVMYIPAAPWCPRNAAYAPKLRAAFLGGASPDDFPAEHYEEHWTGRFDPADLNQIARRGLGFPD